MSVSLSSLLKPSVDSDTPSVNSFSSLFSFPISPRLLHSHNDCNQSLGGGRGGVSWMRECLDEEGGQPSHHHGPSHHHCLPGLPQPVSLLQHRPCSTVAQDIPAENASVVPHLSWDKVQTPSNALHDLALPPHPLTQCCCPPIGSSKLSRFLPQGFTHCCSLCPECSSHSPFG